MIVFYDRNGNVVDVSKLQLHCTQELVDILESQ